MSEFESFVQNWESYERSRHAELLRDLKREFHAAPRSIALEETIAPHSLRLPPAVSRQQSYRRYPGRSMNRSSRKAEDNRAKRQSP